MTSSPLKQVVLAPLPEHLRVKDSGHDDEYMSPWFLGESGGIFTFKFGRSIFTFDLNISLDDNSVLTDLKNLSLYSLIKSWIHVQHYPRSKNMLHMKNRTAKKKLLTVLKVIDKIFLNSQILKLHRFGFGLVTPGTINTYFREILDSNNANESIYSWSKTLSLFLLEKIRHSQDYDFEAFTAAHPEFLEPIADEENCYLNMNNVEIFQARVWLYHNNYYRKSEDEVWPGHIKTGSLVKLLYPNCIMAGHLKPSSYELEIQSIYGYQRQLPRIPVREEKSGATTFRYNEFRNCLMLQKNIKSSTLKISDITLSHLANQDHKSDLARVGSYVTLPHRMTIETLKRSILYYEDHADEVFNYVSKVVCLAAENKIKPAECHLQYFAALDANQNLYKVWDSRAVGDQESAALASETLANKTQGTSALQAYYTLMGSIQYTVGFFTARRQSELLNLKFKDVNFDQNYMSTYVMKTGIGEERLTFDIPLIPLITRMLHRMKVFFESCGFSQNLISQSHCFARFSQSHASGIIKCDHQHYNCHLDALCDHVETDVVNGQRYYVRQHQLRRAFAIGFFYLNTRGSLSVLSYFFGHMDFKAIYRYLTTVIGNKEMIDIKSAYLAEESLKQGSSAQNLLSKLGLVAASATLKVHERARLETYYRALLERQQVSVTPNFFSIDGAEQMLISITVRNNKHGQ